MTGDYRLFIKVHNGFPEHRKTVGLTDRAFRRLVEVWCYCSRNLNDGRLTNAQVSQLFSRKVLNELIAAGYMLHDEHGWEVHGYLDHQMSAEQVADLREKRTEAGKRGGKAKANHVALASRLLKQNASKPLADIDVDRDTDTNNSTDSHVSNASADHTAADEPRSKTVHPNINRIAKRYTDLVKLSDRGKVCAVVLNAVGAGYQENQIGEALERLGHLDMPVTADTLRIEINGKTNGRSSPTRIPTSDQRVMDGLAIAQRLAAEEQAADNHALEIDA